ncbi:hypothetical protein GOBAR_DD08299 [Gossypium barbadense]|nr:hypothetical protein GOBAR_DD08299 [Gossypium barbadense]
MRYNTCMLEAMKPFMNMFMASQKEEGIEWPGQSNGSSMDDEDEEEKVDEEGSDKGEAADDEATEDHDATPYANTKEDVFTPTVTFCFSGS